MARDGGGYNACGKHHINSDSYEVRRRPKLSRVCLVCNHSDKDCESSSEVEVCPKCNGAFVDKFRSCKYQHATPKECCKHNYRVLSDSIDIIKCRADGGIKNIRVEGMVLFHCTKCLDIQKKVIK